MRWVALCFCVSLVSVMFLVNHDPWSMRFVLFFPAILSIAAAQICEARREIRVIAFTGILLQFLGTMVPGDLSAEVVAKLSRMDWRERTVAKAMDAWTSEESVCFLVYEPVHNRGESYLLYRPDFSCRVVYPRASSPLELLIVA